MGEIVKRAGLVIAGKKRRRTEPYTQPLAYANEIEPRLVRRLQGLVPEG
jgi:hypothetical protein